MPKTEKIYTKNVNVRISLEEYEKWDKYTKAKGYNDISKLVRYATNGVVDEVFQENKTNENHISMKKRLETLENENKEILKEQREILRVIAKKSPEPKDLKLRDYQKGLIINLLEEKSRNPIEIGKIISDLEEIEILTIINDLLETGIIKVDEKNKTKYKVVK